MACEECEDVRDALIGAIKTLEALLKFKGGTKPAEPKRVILACNIDAFLYPDGRLRVEARHESYDGMPPPPITLSLDSEATKRLATLLRDGE